MLPPRHLLALLFAGNSELDDPALQRLSLDPSLVTEIMPQQLPQRLGANTGQGAGWPRVEITSPSDYEWCDFLDSS